MAIPILRNHQQNGGFLRTNKKETSATQMGQHSMDWFKGTSWPKTVDFPMKIMGLSGFNFPFNQSIEFMSFCFLKFPSYWGYFISNRYVFWSSKYPQKGTYQSPFFYLQLQIGELKETSRRMLALNLQMHVPLLFLLPGFLGAHSAHLRAASTEVMEEARLP